MLPCLIAYFISLITFLHISSRLFVSHQLFLALTTFFHPYRVFASPITYLHLSTHICISQHVFQFLITLLHLSSRIFFSRHNISSPIMYYHLSTPICHSQLVLSFLITYEPPCHPVFQGSLAGNANHDRNGPKISPAQGRSPKNLQRAIVEPAQGEDNRFRGSASGIGE